MKQFLFSLFFFTVVRISAQEVIRIKNGSVITVQNGIELTIQGGITLENGSLLINNGSTRILNNIVANQSDWKDNSSIGALGGTGLVIFNSDALHQYWGPTHFYNVRINTDGLTINNHFIVENQLNLIKGKINTGTNYVFLDNSAATSLVNAVENTSYSKSWINGNFRRVIASNIGTYDFPVGNAIRSNLLQFLNNNLTGTTYITASFGPKTGTDVGLNVSENGVAYTSINNNGVWYLTPDMSPIAGNYALQLYFNGFTGFSDNLFGMVRRPDASTSASDWKVPPGSLLEPLNGLGRKLSDGFARRTNISSFSQWGIGMMGSVPCINCPSACTYTQGFYGNVAGMACYNNSGGQLSAAQLMLNAFGASTSQVFGTIANRRFFTLYKTDITNGNIFKMLPGTGNSQPIAVDNILPYNGAYYGDGTTWSLIPIQATGSQKGKINNQLLSQTISLWFNLRTSNVLGGIDLGMDTLVTVAQTSCGSGILTGAPIKFGLPHNIVLYLNGTNGYNNNVNGLFQLANDVLGGVNRATNAADVQSAVATINNAFDGCRVLTGVIPYANSVIPSATVRDKMPVDRADELIVTAYPNPYYKQFSLDVFSPVTGAATIEFFSSNGQRIHVQKNFVIANKHIVVPYTGKSQNGSVLYTVIINDYRLSGIVVGIN